MLSLKSLRNGVTSDFSRSALSSQKYIRLRFRSSQSCTPLRNVASPAQSSRKQNAIEPLYQATAICILTIASMSFPSNILAHPVRLDHDLDFRGEKLKRFLLDDRWAVAGS